MDVHAAVEAIADEELRGRLLAELADLWRYRDAEAAKQAANGAKKAKKDALKDTDKGREWAAAARINDGVGVDGDEELAQRHFARLYPATLEPGDPVRVLTRDASGRARASTERNWEFHGQDAAVVFLPAEGDGDGRGPLCYLRLRESGGVVGARLGPAEKRVKFNGRSDLQWRAFESKLAPRELVATDDASDDSDSDDDDDGRRATVSPPPPPEPTDASELVVGAALRKKWLNVSPRFFTGRVTSIDKETETFKALWDDDEETVHALSEAAKMLKDAVYKDPASIVVRRTNGAAAKAVAAGTVPDFQRRLAMVAAAKQHDLKPAPEAAKVGGPGKALAFKCSILFHMFPEKNRHRKTKGELAVRAKLFIELCSGFGRVTAAVVKLLREKGFTVFSLRIDLDPETFPDLCGDVGDFLPLLLALVQYFDVIGLHAAVPCESGTTCCSQQGASETDPYGREGHLDHDISPALAERRANQNTVLYVVDVVCKAYKDANDTFVCSIECPVRNALYGKPDFRHWRFVQRAVSREYHHCVEMLRVAGAKKKYKKPGVLTCSGANWPLAGVDEDAYTCCGASCGCEKVPSKSDAAVYSKPVAKMIAKALFGDGDAVMHEAAYRRAHEHGKHGDRQIYNPALWPKAKRVFKRMERSTWDREPAPAAKKPKTRPPPAADNARRAAAPSRHPRACKN